MIRCLIIGLIFSASLSSCSEYKISKKDFAHLIEMRGTHPEIPELDSIALRISRKPEIINELYNDSSKVTEYFMEKFGKEENRKEVIEDLSKKGSFFVTSAQMYNSSYNSEKENDRYVCNIASRHKKYLVLYRNIDDKWYLNDIRPPLKDPLPAIDLSK